MSLAFLSVLTLKERMKPAKVVVLLIRGTVLVSMDEINDVGSRRLRHLQATEGELSFEDDYMDTEVGTRGLIRIIDHKGDVIGLEFIEPEEAWADPDAVEEYSDTLEDGISVTVIVADKERLHAEAMLREEVGKRIRVLSYGESAIAGWR
jgi:hypothetical protein